MPGREHENRVLTEPFSLTGQSIFVMTQITELAAITLGRSSQDLSTRFGESVSTRFPRKLPMSGKSQKLQRMEWNEPSQPPLGLFIL